MELVEKLADRAPPMDKLHKAGFSAEEAEPFRLNYVGVPKEAVVASESLDSLVEVIAKFDLTLL